MTKEELATMLDGRQYLAETTPQIEQLARDNNLLIVYGGSDDLCEFRGAIDDEIDCYDGGTITNEKLLKLIEAIWCPKDVECFWAYKTDLPYSEFRIFEDDGVYCVGIVVDLSQQKE